jgi:hypothetical protein
MCGRRASSTISQRKTCITISYAPEPIPNAVESLDIINAPQLKLGTPFIATINTDISGYAVVITFNVLSDDKLNINIRNLTGQTITLPPLELKIYI